MWIPRQTPCSLHPVFQARPHLWGYYQITPWTAYRDDPLPPKVMTHGMRAYFWRMPVDILVWMYRHLCLTAALIYPKLVKKKKTNTPLWASDVCVCVPEEDYEHLTSIIITYRCGKTVTNEAAELKNNRKLTCVWPFFPTFVGAEQTDLYPFKGISALKQQANIMQYVAVQEFDNLVITLVFEFLLHLNFFPT